MVTFSTPALLFPAVSLLLLAYTNRFLALAALIRSLHRRYHETKDPFIVKQIKNLKSRVILIKRMQLLGVLALVGSVMSMLEIYQGFQQLGSYTFIASLLLFFVSLILSTIEIQLSVRALNIQIQDIESFE